MNWYHLNDANVPILIGDSKAYIAYVKQFGDIRRPQFVSAIWPFRISTVFLIMDHRWNWLEEQGDPLLFETMIFGHTWMDLYMRRYTTYEEAMDGHKEAISWLKRNYLRLLPTILSQYWESFLSWFQRKIDPSSRQSYWHSFFAGRAAKEQPGQPDSLPSATPVDASLGTEETSRKPSKKS